MPDNMIDGTDNHLFELIKGRGILSLVYLGRPKEDKESFNADHYCLLDPEYIKEIDIDPLVYENKV